MNTIRYEVNDGILIEIFIWMLIIFVLVLAPYVIGGIALKQNVDLRKRVDYLERLVIKENASTNQIQIINQ